MGAARMIWLAIAVWNIHSIDEHARACFKRHTQSWLMLNVLQIGLERPVGAITGQGCCVGTHSESRRRKPTNATSQLLPRYPKLDV